MELDVRINKAALSITIDNPFHLDLDDLVGRIDRFLASDGEKLNGLDVKGLLPLMVKGIAGCEAGCPANAKSLVEQGYRNFSLQYIEGGILSASAHMANGKILALKLFPDF
jgi:hypothetical protein